MPAEPAKPVLPYKIVDEGLLLQVIVTPKSSRDEIYGVELIKAASGEAASCDVAVLRVRVRAIPDKGLANKAVTQLFAKWLRVPKSSVELKTGSKARHKVLLVAGSGEALAGLVAELMEQQF